MNWTQEPDPRRLALLDRLVRANQALWERFSLDAQLARVGAVRDALAAGCGIEQVASALGVHVSEVDVTAWTGLDSLTGTDSMALAGTVP
jgi:predicted hotdog family 3-hydroxylacyl-ACP dehydratase